MADIEPTRAIVSPGETNEGKIIPTERRAINRPVTIHENATVTDAVYGEEVSIEADATVDGPVMARESVRLTGGRVSADIGTGGKLVDERGRVAGTVVGTRVTLSDCVLYGNVVGEDVILEDCLVLGLVVAERTLELRETTCYTFKCFGEATLDRTNIVIPQAVVDGGLELETPVSVLAIPEADLDDRRDGDPRLTRADLVEHDDTRYLTLAPRLLRLSEISNRIDAVEDLLTDVVVSLKTDDPDRPAFDKSEFESELVEVTQQ